MDIVQRDELYTNGIYHPLFLGLEQGLLPNIELWRREQELDCKGIIIVFLIQKQLT